MKGTFIVSIICMALAVTFAATLDMQLAAKAETEQTSPLAAAQGKDSPGTPTDLELSQAN